MLLTRLRIAEAMRGKVVLGGSGRIAELVARGEAEMAVQQIPELLPVEGVDFGGARCRMSCSCTPCFPRCQRHVQSEGRGHSVDRCLHHTSGGRTVEAKGLAPMPR